MAIAGRIEDQAVIAVAAAQLAFDELVGVLDDPVDGRVGQAGSSAFRLAHATMFLAASTWTTSAPAAAAAMVLPPV